MTTNLIALNIRNDPGENVETFSKKFDGLERIIQGSGMETVDLSVLVIRTCISFSVTYFKLKVTQFHNHSEIDT